MSSESEQVNGYIFGELVESSEAKPKATRVAIKVIRRPRRKLWEVMVVEHRNFFPVREEENEMK
jgi:hypothetical protein